MRRKQNVVMDEMQEQKLLRIGEHSAELCFWGLAAAIVIQCVVGTTLREIAGEALILALMSVYMTAAALRNGLWTKNSAPDTGKNALISLIPAGLTGAVMAARCVILDKRLPVGSMLLLMAVVYAGCLLSLTLLGRSWTKRRRRLDEPYDEEKEPK